MRLNVDKRRSHSAGVMKSKMWPCITAATLLFTAMAMPNGMEGQAVQNQTATHQRYTIVDLGTLGGPSSYFWPFQEVVNARGEAVIGADTPNSDPSNPCFNPIGPVTDCFIQHAAVWNRGKLLDLGTLPSGTFSSPLCIADNGLIAGGSDIGVLDPLTGEVEQRAVLWQDKGKMMDLGTLGGNQSQAVGVNARGEVIGAALNTIPDAYSLAANWTGSFAAATQTRAFQWQNGVMHDLGTLGGPDAFALYINEPGQVAGISYTSSTPDPNTGLPPIHPFLWQHGQMFDLGTFGGASAGVYDLNNAGQVVGVMDLTGDQTWHPFLWDRGHLVDLGTLGGDTGVANAINDSSEIVGQADLPGSQGNHGFIWRDGRMTDLGTLGTNSSARWINSKGQVVGKSLIGHVTPSHHGFLWENGGPMIDLNVLVPMGSALTIEQAYFINELGEIAANGVFSNGDQHAILLVPDGNCDDLEARIAALQNSAALAQNQPVIKQVEPASPAIQFRNRFLQRDSIPSPAAAPLN
ncbi:MAG: hypothetical protein WBW33_09090 [Bryobacteraceae bacterium]